MNDCRAQHTTGRSVDRSIDDVSLVTPDQFRCHARSTHRSVLDDRLPVVVRGAQADARVWIRPTRLRRTRPGTMNVLCL